MACGGLKFIESSLDPELKKLSPAERTVRLSMEMLAFIEDYTYKAGKRLHIKIGVHYGSCIFGVLGYHKPQFSLIGDTINTTSRHCTTGDKGRIVLSEACYQEIKGLGVCKIKKMKVAMKGKGDEITIYVVRKKNLKPSRKPLLSTNQTDNMRESQPGSRRMSIQGDLGDRFERNPHRLPSLLEEEKSFLDEPNGKDSERPDKGYSRSFANLDDIDFVVQQSAQSINSDNKDEEPETADSKQNPVEPKKTEEDQVATDPDKPEALNTVKPTIFYEEKLFRNYDGYLNLGLIYTIFDLVVAEILYWADSGLINKNPAFRICYLAIILLYTIFLIIKQLRRNTVAFKFYFMVVLVCRHLLCAVEYVVSHYQSPESPATHYQLMYVAMSQLYGSACDMLFICASGVFLWKQILYLNIYITSLHIICLSIHNVPAYQYFIFIILNGMCFNLLSSWRICSKQLESFFRIVSAKKKSVYLSKFVDRLLPKHVVTGLTVDTRGEQDQQYAGREL